MSLGPSHGAAVIGQPLDLHFDLSLDAEGEAPSTCPQAEVFYGETRVDPSRLRVAVLPGAKPDQARVRLLSSVVVNEPVVSVLLRAGCGQALSRRYVLLASAPMAAAAETGQAAATIASTLPSLVPSASSGTGAPRLVDKAAAVRPKSPAKSEAAAVTAPVRRPKPASAPAKASEPGRPRLELQSPLDWLEERDVQLRPSMEMAVPVPATPEQRAAAAASWRSLAMEAPAVAVEAPAAVERLQALETQLKALQVNEARERSRTAELQAQLDEVGRDRQTQWIVTALVAVLAMALGALLVGWRRLRQDGARSMWWAPRSTVQQDSEPALSPEWVAEAKPSPDTAVPPPITPPVMARPPVPVAAPVPINVVTDVDTAWLDLPEVAVPSVSPKAAADAGDALRAPGLDDEQVDAQQNAEFYVSLGQYEQAIELLQHYIAAHPGISPAVYLDLLKILHTLSLTDDYRRLREEFNAIFNADVPAFAGFLKSARRLEDYPDALASIQARWDQPEVLEVIEACLYRSSGPVQPLPFELEAYRELLLLYAMAKSLHGASGMARVARPAAPEDRLPAAMEQPEAFAAHMPMPLPDAHRPSSPMASLQQHDIGEAGFPAPLTFDLSLDDEPEDGSQAKPSASVVARASGVDAEVGFAPAPAGDSNLIDFDLFDVEVLPSSGKGAEVKA
ncbi:tetratricopeptide repeat protein [Xylophilus sp. GW821-FHT01B05]